MRNRIILAAGAALMTVSCGGRPSASEVAVADFVSGCESKKNFEQNCEGKFVRWEGTIKYVGSEKILMDVGSGETIDIVAKASEKDDVRNRKVLFSGFLQKSKFLRVPIVDDAKIEQYLNTPSAAEGLSLAENAPAPSSSSFSLCDYPAALTVREQEEMCPGRRITVAKGFEGGYIDTRN